MADLPLVTYPNPQLRQVVGPVVDFDVPELSALIADMEQTLRRAKGLGLAAPQVGSAQRVVLVNTRDGMLALVNPNISERSAEQETGEEGCLSVPRVFGLVSRAKSIGVQAQTAAGETVTFRADGLFARVIQHEIDHLDGILFIDRVKKFTGGSVLLKGMWEKFLPHRTGKTTTSKH
ncbi:MAG: peptide deformylase [Patescibacteria group bacterium]|nr:peptide deformylase [Patescibacteria group bacterium]